ncbi:MAG: ATP-binding protein [bacterium]
MKNRFFLRIFISLFLVAAMSMIVLLLVSVDGVTKYYLSTVESGMEKSLTILSSYSTDILSRKDTTELESLFVSVSKSTGYRLTLIDTAGNVILDSDENPKSMTNHKDRKEIEIALRGEVGKSNRFSITRQQDMLYIAVPLKMNQEISAILRIATYMEHADEAVEDFYGRFTFLVLFVLIGMLIVSYLLTKNVYGPIDRLVTASKRISNGDFDARIVIFRKDELKVLAESFNTMAEKVKKLFHQTEESRDELNKIIKTMHEGVLVIDGFGRVVLSNESAERMFSFKDMEGKNFREIVRNPDFNELVSRCILEKKEISGEFRNQNLDIVVNLGYIEGTNETVVTFFDITAIKDTDRIRRDFIMNASHELRTPLTAIKGFIEAMSDNVEGENRKYLEIIERHTERLVNIVEDLLSLSSLEHAERLNMELTDPVRLTEEVIGIMKPKAEKKKLILSFEHDSPPKMHLDIFKIEQVLINLIDNAIKYTDNGFVKVSLRHDGESLFIDVEDSGIGISNEHRQRIFERFYVADKSRSKKSGGTGLGLAIVKHIVLLHDGAVDFKSGSNGTLFSVKLPLNKERSGR